MEEEEEKEEEVESEKKLFCFNSSIRRICIRHASKTNRCHMSVTNFDDEINVGGKLSYSFALSLGNASKGDDL